MSAAQATIGMVTPVISMATTHTQLVHSVSTGMV